MAGQTVRRNPYVDEAETGGISVVAADPSLRATVGATLRRGTFLNAATGRYPAVVLGAEAAATLGIDDAGARVWLGERWFTVIGILEPGRRSRRRLDTTALIGFAVAERLFGEDGNAVDRLRARRPGARRGGARPARRAPPTRSGPEEVDVSRPSDALEARAAAKTAFTSLFLGLGAVALLVGGVGIANVMVISVLERRSEIGLRRALGATRRNVGVQFLAESLLLAGCGGAAGTAARRAGHGRLRDLRGLDRGACRRSRWPAACSSRSSPAASRASTRPCRAARLSPTEALRAA